MATPTFQKNVMGYVQTVPGNTAVEFEVRSFKRFGAISI